MMSGAEDTDAKACDPGWNDPPYFSYEHTSYEQKNKSGKSHLNKRVVHTFSMPMERSQFSGDGPPTSPVLPDKPPKGKSTTPPTEQPVDTFDDEKEDIEVSLSDTLYNFLAVLEDIRQQNEKDSIEIKKRLDILEKMWIDGSFPKDVQKKIYSMSIALTEKNEEEVNRLQRVLMVNHSRLCSSWMAGIRKLINANLNP
ncbi:steroid receptor RNA activator 1-like isoform X2 [Cimex lectularius]|nr:steroid receptor RNA activator 1-like isoform X2 [Cimex lectularius]